MERLRLHNTRSRRFGRLLEERSNCFEEVKKIADQFGQKVTGSEICGVVPLEAILESGRYFGTRELDEKAAVESAVRHLGLADLEPFFPDKKVLELVLQSEKAIDPCNM